MTRYCEMCDVWIGKRECPDCGMPTRRSESEQAYNARTRLLVPTGAAHRDKLVAERLALRRTT